MTQKTPYQRTAAVLLTVGVLAATISGGAGLAEQAHHTPWWWSAVVMTGACTALAASVLGALGYVRPFWGALCFVLTTLGALTTLALVSDATYSGVMRPWPETFIPIAVAACALVFRSWTLGGLAGITVLLTHAWLQLTDDWGVSVTTVVSDGVYNFTLLGMSLGVVLALRHAGRTVRREASAAASSFARARTTEQLSMHNARWDALVHDRVLAALETIARTETEPEAREAARTVAAQLTEGPSVEVDAVTLRNQLLQAVLSTYPLADTRFPPELHQGAVPVPDRVAQALSMALAEALRNAAAHAYSADRPGPVVVQLSHDSCGVRVRVSDSGRGFRRDEVAPTSFGVALSIENRMDAVRGRGTVSSRPGGGTEVELAWSPRGDA